MKRFTSVFLFVFFLLFGEARADTLTGGTSQVKVADYTILIRGGIVQSVKGSTINFWLLGLDAEIRIGKNPPDFTREEENLPLISQPRLPQEIPLIIPSLQPESSPIVSTAPFSVDAGNAEDSSDESSPDDTASEEENLFILNLINLNSMRVVVEGDAEIYQESGSSDESKSQQVSADDEKSGLESNQIIIKTPFPVGEEISRIRISTRYAKENHFRFVVMGDSKDGLDIFKSILRKVRNIRPLFFAHLGDIVGSGTRREYQQILRLMSQVHFPFFISIGNNDTLSQGRTIYHYWLGQTYYSFNYRNSHFVFLDDSLGLIDENQFRWLREDLQKNRTRNIFLFMHIPPYDPRQARSYEITASQNAGLLMDLASEFKVKRIYSSHINSYFKFTRQGIPIIITGGAGSRLINKKSYHHFLLVTVKGDKVSERVIRID